LPSTTRKVMSKREEFYECVFASGKSEYEVHLRAWTEIEAELVLREALENDHVASSGTLVIRNLRGDILRRSRYVPSAPSGTRPHAA
jgi:hypothetical protein